MLAAGESSGHWAIVAVVLVLLSTTAAATAPLFTRFVAQVNNYLGTSGPRPGISTNKMWMEYYIPSTVLSTIPHRIHSNTNIYHNFAGK